MTRALKWLIGIVVAIGLALAAVAIGLQSWIGTPDFRARVSREASAAAGVKVEVGGLSVDLWPLPAVAVEGVQIKSQPPLTLERIEARPAWLALLRGRPQLATLVVRRAVIPQEAIASIATSYRKAHPEKPGQAKKEKSDATVALPQHMVLDTVTWVEAKGDRHVIDAEATMDDDGLPESFDVSVAQGRWKGVQAKLRRDETDRWKLQGKVGGGTIQGVFNRVKSAKGTPMLEGRLDTANVEVGTFTAPSRTLTGRLEAHTTLRCDLRDLGAIADVMQTQTKFTVDDAVIHGIDLAQAVKTVGMNRSGETRLDTLAGQLTTRGRAAELSNLVASSGTLSANGNVALAADKHLSGHVTVSLASQATAGALGVPLVVGGTMDSPSVTLSRGALAGAAIGTVIAPGLGTGAGANVGDRIGQSLSGLFAK
jgi:uncharacterized protein involved in outer membrane biogenesis